jgi:hypothetical protein
MIRQDSLSLSNNPPLLSSAVCELESKIIRLSMAFSDSKQDTRTRLAANRAGMHAAIWMNFSIVQEQQGSRKFPGLSTKTRPLSLLQTVPLQSQTSSTVRRTLLKMHMWSDRTASFDKQFARHGKTALDLRSAGHEKSSAKDIVIEHR